MDGNTIQNATDEVKLDHVHPEEMRSFSGLDYRWHEHPGAECTQGHHYSCPESVGFDCQLVDENLCSCVDIVDTGDLSRNSKSPPRDKRAWDHNNIMMERENRTPIPRRHDPPPSASPADVDRLLLAVRLAKRRNAAEVKALDTDLDDKKLIEALSSFFLTCCDQKPGDG